MARAELKTSWIVSGEIEGVQTAMRKFLNQRGMRVVDESDSEIRFAQGSQFLTRFLGGWFVSSAWLPKTGRLVATETETGVRIRASIEESLGFGYFDPLLKSKYEKFFEEWMNDLQSVLE
jgi:hypothetical protein